MEIAGRFACLDCLGLNNGLGLFIFLLYLYGVVACWAENRNNSHWFRCFAVELDLDRLGVPYNYISSGMLRLVKERRALPMLLNLHKQRIDDPVLRSLKFYSVVLFGQSEIERLCLGLLDLLFHFLKWLACWWRKNHRILSLYVLKRFLVLLLLMIVLLFLVVALIEYIRHCFFYMNMSSSCEVLHHI